MIHWCAYCLTFLGEVEPYDRYQLSFGVCPGCAPRIRAFSLADQERLEALAGYFIRLEEAGLSGTHLEVTHLLAEGQRLGIAPLDLMMGMLQPLLVKIGDLWAAGLVTVAAEHRCSSLVAEMLAKLRPSTSQETSSPRPDLLLVSPRENQHTLGLQMAEAYFEAHGIPTLLVSPGFPTAGILDLVNAHEPRALGFSVALPAQLGQVQEVAQRLHGRQLILVGGPGARLGLHPDPSLGIKVCKDLATAGALLSVDARGAGSRNQ